MKSQRKSKKLLLLLAALVGFFPLLNGCWVSIDDKEIARIELSLYDGNQLQDPTRGLALYHSYRMSMVVYTTDGRKITRPDYKDLIIESPNGSVLSKLKCNLTRSRCYLLTSTDSVRLRHQKIQFSVRIRNNPFPGKYFSYAINWNRIPAFVYKGIGGSQGSDGSDGSDGVDGMENEDSENGTNGEHGEDGQDGQDGANGPSIRVYATMLQEKVNGAVYKGLLFKLVVGNQAPTYHYTRSTSVFIKSIGGRGGNGGDGGKGGDGGDAVTSDVEDYEGGMGGNGGNGGHAGDGGHGGRIQVYYLGGADKMLRLQSLPGDGGRGGDGDDGGKGGKGASELLDGEDGSAGEAGENGRHGLSGKIPLILISKDEMYGHFKGYNISKADLSGK